MVPSPLSFFGKRDSTSASVNRDLMVLTGNPHMPKVLGRPNFADQAVMLGKKIPIFSAYGKTNGTRPTRHMDSMWREFHLVIKGIR